MLDMMRFSTFCLIGASFLVSCGGGGSSSTSAVVSPPPAAVAPPPANSTNNVPVANASSATTKVTVGGKFTVTAANSSDPNGDNLSFTWAQTAGPNVLPSGSFQATSLVLNAPIVTQDTILTFEVTASDGTNNNTDSVNVTVEPIGSPVSIRPNAPINTDIAILNGITNEGDDQYRIYWVDGFSTQANNIIASQVFSDDGTPIGAQTNGSFEIPQAGSTSSTQINGLFPISIVENGGTIYSPSIYIFENASPHLGNLIGPFEGNLSPVADPFLALNPGGERHPLFQNGSFFDVTPIGQNNLISVTSRSDGSSAFIFVNIFNPDGSIEENIPFAYEEMAPAGDPSATVSTVSNPAVTAIGEDSYIVAWRREDTNARPRLRTIEAQIYTSNNELSGQRLTLDMSAGPSPGGINLLDAATFGNGSSLITWVESQNFAANGDFIDFSLRGRIVNLDGTFATDEFSVSDSANEQFTTTSLSLSNGDVLVFWGEGDNTLKARLVSRIGSSASLGSEFELSQNAASNSFIGHQTQTGRVILGYNSLVGNTAIANEFISFCPVGCE